MQIERQEIIRQIHDYMENDGLNGYLKSGCKDGWGTLQMVPSLFENNHLTKEDVIDLIHKAHDMFGDCQEARAYILLKSQFPEAFK